jgi:hypothetical protein
MLLLLELKKVWLPRRVFINILSVNRNVGSPFGFSVEEEGVEAIREIRRYFRRK